MAQSEEQLPGCMAVQRFQFGMRAAGTLQNSFKALLAHHAATACKQQDMSSTGSLRKWLQCIKRKKMAQYMHYAPVDRHDCSISVERALIRLGQCMPNAHFFAIYDDSHILRRAKLTGVYALIV